MNEDQIAVDLWQKHLPAVRVYLKRHLPNGWKDVVQDLFLGIRKSIEDGRFPDQSDPKAAGKFIGGIARNLQRTEHRKTSRAVQLEKPPDYVDPKSLIDDENQRGLKRQVREALSRLSDEDRDILVCVYYWGISQAELADHLGLTATSVRQRVNRARKRLKEILRSSSSSFLVTIFSLLTLMGGRGAIYRSFVLDITQGWH